MIPDNNKTPTICIEKHILNEECGNCFEKYKDILENRA